MALYSFSTDLRIRCAADYKSVFDGALFKVHQPHFLFLAKLTEQPNSRLGIVVAKKKVRRAHERNRIKRRARESPHQQKQKFGSDIDVVVMPKVGIETITNAELYQQLDFAWQKLQRLAKKHSKVVPTSQN